MGLDNRLSECFQESEGMIKSEQVFTHYNPHLPIRLSCDASPFGLGAVLSHEDRRLLCIRVVYSGDFVSLSQNHFVKEF